MQVTGTYIVRISNGQALKNKINKMDIFKVKMLLVKKFSSKKAKFKGFLT